MIGLFGGFSFIIILLYSWMLLWMIRQWQETEEFSLIDENSKYCNFSVIIAARNEAENISACLKSISNNTYPKNNYEIIVVDDFSTDNTLCEIENAHLDNVRIIKMSDFLSYKRSTSKKGALSEGISQAKGEYIVTIDADCIASKNWLRVLNSYIQKSQASFIAGLVYFKSDSSFLQKFQSLDSLSSMLVTAAGIRSQQFFICNGANLCYKKRLFYDLGGFEGNSEYASGDDVFLIQKAAKYNPSTVYFLKSKYAIVRTKSETNFKDFWNQRLRWATKSKGYFWDKITLMSMLIFAANLLLLINFTLSFFLPYYHVVFLAYIILKFTLDYRFFRTTEKFLAYKSSRQYFLISFLCYPFYFLCLSFFALFKNQYIWKNRVLK